MSLRRTGMVRMGFRRMHGEDLPPPPPLPLALSVGWTSESQYATNGSNSNEQLLAGGGVVIDFDILDPAIVNLIPHFAALVTNNAVESPATSTFNVYVGGTIDTIDGTLVASIIYTAAAGGVWVKTGNVGGPFARPAGRQLVKLTGTDSAGDISRIRCFSCNFESA